MGRSVRVRGRNGFVDCLHEPNMVVTLLPSWSWCAGVPAPVVQYVLSTCSTRKCARRQKYAHAGSRTRVTSMGGLYDAATLHARYISELVHTYMDSRVLRMPTGSELCVVAATIRSCFLEVSKYTCVKPARVGTATGNSCDAKIETR